MSSPYNGCSYLESVGFRNFDFKANSENLKLGNYGDLQITISSGRLLCNKEMKVLTRLSSKALRFIYLDKIKFTGKQFSKILHSVSHVNKANFNQCTILKAYKFKVNIDMCFKFKSLSLGFENFREKTMQLLVKELGNNISLRRCQLNLAL